MHLKSLTLKGFKSFASSTTLRFEPGITAVVGPNGSGKSNVVDAIAWVLGEQGAKALRGGKMDDVIFAGTAARPPLGRAEVTLTIDNTDGALPIDYAEVSITRRMFRNGVGEYEINGSACRLLDIQELLSDSGIGREMHIIVGQGQLDAVLSARPEDRRAFIEEAAGVLKHRKRKERALRKLEAMQANLTRVTDLTGELRRQLGPLGRQAAVARRAAGVQADLRDARMRLLAEDLAVITAQRAAGSAAEADAQALRAALQARLAAAVAEQQRAATAVDRSAPELQRAQDTWFSLSSLAERVRGTQVLAEERHRHLNVPAELPRPGREPEELDAAADRAEEEQNRRHATVDGARAALAGSIARRTALEEELQRAERALLDASRAIADRREGLATLSGQVGAARSEFAAADGEVVRLEAAAAGARDRERAARAVFEDMRGSIGDLDSSEQGLDAAHETAAGAAAEARERLESLAEARRTTATTQARLRARVEALSLGLDRRDGAGALLAADPPGLLGSVATLLDVTPGAELAVAAALGPVADAVAVDGLAAAAAALRGLGAQDVGHAGILIGTGPSASGQHGAEPIAEPTGPVAEFPPGARWAVEFVRSPPALRQALRSMLDGVAVVDNLDDAEALVRASPGARAVTRDGDLLGDSWASGGRAGPSALEMQAALDATAADLAGVTGELADLEAQHVAAREDLGARDEEAAGALAALHDSDARLSALSETLARQGQTARAASEEADRLERQRGIAAGMREQHRATLVELEARLAAARRREADAPREEVDTGRRDVLAVEAGQARQREVDGRLTLRSAEERAQATAGAADGLRRAARAERDARRRADTAAMRRASNAAGAAEVAAAARTLGARLQTALEAATRERAEATLRRADADAALTAGRATCTELQHELERLTDAAHRDELVRAQQTLRMEQLSERAMAEFATAPEELIDGYGPDVPVPPSLDEMQEYRQAKDRGEVVAAPQAMAYDRPTQERRARRAERDLATLGRVNPLALEEFAALEERHAFLSTQLEDLKATRKDLLGVIQEVDEKIQEVFDAAYADVAREFVTVFATLFPGGEGELVLTDPGDLVTTGIEVHARPPGKKVKRLSLLSGGERSLTAVALLVAIFRARPSPFYVLDEVEAALDEVNLTRLVQLLTELRSSSQLIVITHQKFTMESADALYGVSMRGDGITAVISQRIRDLAVPA